MFAVYRKVAAGAFSWADTAALVDKMGALVVSHAAPARRQALADQQRELFVTSAVASMTLGTPASQREAAVAVCGMLRFQLDAVRVITTDLANTRLRDIAPVVAAHGVEYEQRKIRDKLASGALVFTATKVVLCYVALSFGCGWHLYFPCQVWLQQAMALVPGTQSLHNHGTFVRVHNEAMMLLVAPHPNAEPLALPESLAMDVRRIEAARAEFKYLVGAAAAVSIVESRGTSDATFARRVALALAEAPCTAQVDMIVVNQLSGVDAPELRVSLAVLVAMVRAVAAEGYMDQVCCVE